MSSLAGLGHYHHLFLPHCTHCNCAALHCTALQCRPKHQNTALTHSLPLWPDPRNGTLHAPLYIQKIEMGFSL